VASATSGPCPAPRPKPRDAQVNRHHELTPCAKQHAMRYPAQYRSTRRRNHFHGMGLRGIEPRTSRLSGIVGSRRHSMICRFSLDRMHDLPECRGSNIGEKSSDHPKWRMKRSKLSSDRRCRGLSTQLIKSPQNPGRINIGRTGMGRQNGGAPAAVVVTQRGCDRRTPAHAPSPHTHR